MTESPNNSSDSSSFTTTKINSTTFVICENDAFNEHPLIYVKVPTTTSIKDGDDDGSDADARSKYIIISDTGCDRPAPKHENDRFTRLKDYIENSPIPCNDKSLNPRTDEAAPRRRRHLSRSRPRPRPYLVICSHCHYDHVGGMEQFAAVETTAIVASAAGRDFVESDLARHGLFADVGVPVPRYRVTKWAGAFERLRMPLNGGGGEIGDEKVGGGGSSCDLGLTIIHTPGHTPDELAWYDHGEMHLVVGDSFYEEGDGDGDGEDYMPIIFPSDGNLIEWVFSMQKLLVFVRSENARAEREVEQAQRQEEEEEMGGDDVVVIAQRVKISCGHETVNVDGERILEELVHFSSRVLRRHVPVVRKEWNSGEERFTWRESEDGVEQWSIKAPIRLMDEARKFFNSIPKT